MQLLRLISILALLAIFIFGFYINDIITVVAIGFLLVYFEISNLVSVILLMYRDFQSNYNNQS